METIIAAVIGGMATIASVFLHHHLALKREVMHYRLQLAASYNHQMLSYKKQNGNKKRFNDFLVGVGLILLDAIVIVVFVAAFNLRSSEPAWENIFTFIVLGVVPTYALYRLLKGVITIAKQERT